MIGGNRVGMLCGKDEIIEDWWRYETNLKYFRGSTGIFLPCTIFFFLIKFYNKCAHRRICRNDRNICQS